MGQEERGLTSAEEAAEHAAGELEPARDHGSAAAPAGGGRQRFYELGGPTRVLLALALAAIVIYAMKYASGILNPIFLAMFVTMGASPALHWMRRKGLPNWASLTIVLLVIIIAILLFLALMAAMITQLDDKLPVYRENLAEIEASVETWFADHNIDASGLTQGSLAPENILSAVAGILSASLSLFSSLFLVILIVMFMVAEVYALPQRVHARVDLGARFRQSLSNFSQLTRSYLFTKAWLGAIVAIFVTIVYYAFGVDFALMWGLVFFIFSFIPNIGFVLSVIPPFFITLLEFGFTRAAVVVIIVIIVNAIVDNGLSPKIMGRSVGLSSLTVFLSLVFWGWMFGGIGGLLCVPLTLMVKLLFFDNFDSTRPIAVIMETTVSQAVKKSKKRRRKGKAEAEASA